MNDSTPCKESKKRSSNFELLRIVSMFYIVFYHLILFFIVKVDESLFFKAIQIPLHVGVICFLLISGWFHIKFSIRGVFKLLFPLILYYLPLTLYESFYEGSEGGVKLLFFSESPYWFVRVYFYLFLISPVINSFLNTDLKRNYLLLSFGFMSIYMGFRHDPSLLEGKNLTNFLFIYILGDSLRNNYSLLGSINKKILVVLYLSLNVCLVCGYMLSYSDKIGELLWVFSFPYNSPLLIINAVLLFLIFCKLELRQEYTLVINRFSSSVFPVYIIHHQHLILYSFISPVVLWIYNASNSLIILLVSLGLFSLVVMIVCVCIDQLLSPLYLYNARLANYIQNKIPKLEFT